MYPVCTSLCEYVALPFCLQEHLFFHQNLMIKKQIYQSIYFCIISKCLTLPKCLNGNMYPTNILKIANTLWFNPSVTMFYSPFVLKKFLLFLLAGSNDFLLSVFFLPSTLILWRVNFKLTRKNLHSPSTVISKTNTLKIWNALNRYSYLGTREGGFLALEEDV